MNRYDRNSLKKELFKHLENIKNEEKIEYEHYQEITKEQNKKDWFYNLNKIARRMGVGKDYYNQHHFYDEESDQWITEDLYDKHVNPKPATYKLCEF